MEKCQKCGLPSPVIGGPAPTEPYCQCVFAEFWSNERAVGKSGFEPIPGYKICMHPGHNPPTHLYIPPGQQYRHVCPGCGAEVVMAGAPFIW